MKNAIIVAVAAVFLSGCTVLVNSRPVVHHRPVITSAPLYHPPLQCRVVPVYTYHGVFYRRECGRFF